jgi:hypothetical protein
MFLMRSLANRTSVRCGRKYSYRKIAPGKLDRGVNP